MPWVYINNRVYTQYFTLYTLHFTLYTPHFTLYTPHSTLYTPHSTLHALHSTLYTLHFTLHTPHWDSTLHTPHFPLHTPHSTLYTPHSTLYTLHSTLYILHFTLYTPHFSLYTPHSTLHTLHSHSTLYTPHSTLYTPHFTLHTLNSTLYTLHPTLFRIPQSTVHWYGNRGRCRLFKQLVSQKCSTWLHSGSWAASCFFEASIQCLGKPVDHQDLPIKRWIISSIGPLINLMPSGPPSWIFDVVNPMHNAIHPPKSSGMGCEFSPSPVMVGVWHCVYHMFFFRRAWHSDSNLRFVLVNRTSIFCASNA